MMNVFVFSGYVRAKALRNSRAIERSPLVTFDYPSSITGELVFRVVSLISATGSYITGLERTVKNEHPRYQFKKFCQSRIRQFKVVSFNPAAMS